MQARAVGVFWTIPNVISLVRLVFGAPVTLILYHNGFAYAWAIFLFFVALDWLDGFWARRYGSISSLGMMLDPLADQMLVLPILWYFFVDGLYGSGLPLALTIREVFMLFLRGMSIKDMPAILSGKLKVCAEYIGISFFLLGSAMYYIGFAVFLAALVFAIWSAWRYFIIVMREGLDDHHRA